MLHSFIIRRMRNIALAFSILGGLCLSSSGCRPSLPKAELPILGWYSITAPYLTEENFRTMKEDGFNISFSVLPTLEEAKKALDLGEKTGMKVMFLCPEMDSDLENTVAAVKDHPALFGYFMKDEPVNASFPSLAAMAQRILSVDTTHPLYLNLFPNYVDPAILGSSYEEHVHRFIEEVKLPMVSFDYYPVTIDGIRQRWWENLEIISRESRQAGLPFWGFALSTAHGGYPIPSIQDLRLQLYTNLAYGAQGLEYFTYWNSTDGLKNAPVTNTGIKTGIYDTVKEMNAEIQARAGVFSGAEVLSVRHTGIPRPEGAVQPDVSHLCKYIPEGVTPLGDSLPEGVSTLDTGEYGAVVSHLRNGSNTYLVLVNRSVDEDFDYRIGFTDGAHVIRRDGHLARVSSGTHSFHLEEGDCAIFQL